MDRVDGDLDLLRLGPHRRAARRVVGLDARAVRARPTGARRRTTPAGRRRVGGDVVEQAVDDRARPALALLDPRRDGQRARHQPQRLRRRLVRARLEQLERRGDEPTEVGRQRRRELGMGLEEQDEPLERRVLDRHLGHHGRLRRETHQDRQHVLVDDRRRRDERADDGQLERLDGRSDHERVRLRQAVLRVPILVVLRDERVERARVDFERALDELGWGRTEVLEVLAAALDEDGPGRSAARRAGDALLRQARPVRTEQRRRQRDPLRRQRVDARLARRVEAERAHLRRLRRRVARQRRRLLERPRERAARQRHREAV